MAIHVDIDECDEKLKKLASAALRGEEVILKKDGRPAVRFEALPNAIVADRKQSSAKRRNAIGFLREKYAHLPPEAFDVPPSMTDEELDERYRRKFGDPT